MLRECRQITKTEKRNCKITTDEFKRQVITDISVTCRGLWKDNSIEILPVTHAITGHIYRVGQIK